MQHENAMNQVLARSIRISAAHIDDSRGVENPRPTRQGFVSHVTPTMLETNALQRGQALWLWQCFARSFPVPMLCSCLFDHTNLSQPYFCILDGRNCACSQPPSPLISIIPESFRFTPLIICRCIVTKCLHSMAIRLCDKSYKIDISMQEDWKLCCRKSFARAHTP